MSNEKKKVPLGQYGGAEHGVRVMREKIGNVRALGHAEPRENTHVAGAERAQQRAVIQKVIEELQTIFDPEIPLNIYDLGLIYKLSIDPTNAVKVDMTLTAPGCPVAGSIVAEVRRKVQSLPGVPHVEVELVWDPPWTRDRLSEAARLELGLM